MQVRKALSAPRVTEVHFLDPIRIQARTATGVALEEERKDKKKVPLKIEQTAACRVGEE